MMMENHLNDIRLWDQIPIVFQLLGEYGPRIGERDRKQSQFMKSILYQKKVPKATQSIIHHQ